MEMQNGQIDRKVRLKNASKIKTVLVIAIAVILVGAFRYHFNYERRISSFVTKNEPELTVLVEDYLEKMGQRESAGINGGGKQAAYGTNYRGAKIGGVFPASEVVPFDVGGIGIVPAASYYGFYYSPEDIPVSNGEGELKKVEEQQGGILSGSVLRDQKERWSWQGYGDNGGEIVKIKEHWYYYKCWF